jgi:hypothetical protein
MSVPSTPADDAELLAAARHMIALFARANANAPAPAAGAAVASAAAAPATAESDDQNSDAVGGDSPDISALDVFSSSQASAAVFSALLATFAYEVHGSVEPQAVRASGWLGLAFCVMCMFIIVINLMTTVVCTIVDFQSKIVIALATLVRYPKFDAAASKWYMSFKTLRSRLWNLHVSTVPAMFLALAAKSVLSADEGDNVWLNVQAIVFLVSGAITVYLMWHLNQLFNSVFPHLPEWYFQKFAGSSAKDAKKTQ